MKKTIKLPTILGIIILSLGLIAGVFLINSRQIFKLGAQVEANPQNVRITNISDTSLVVTWTTNLESIGFIKWGINKSNIGNVASETNSDKSFVHSVEISGINPGSDVFFEIVSEGKNYDNNGVAWQSKTHTNKTIATNSITASGVILQSDNSTPARAIVYLSINGTILSGITSAQGSWVIPVSNFIQDLPETTVIDITVNAGPLGTSQAVIYPKAIKIIPTIVLGKTYDFRTLESQDQIKLPESNISLPESVNQSSRFEISRPSQTVAETVSLDSIDDGEIITTTDPEFFGKGPAGTTLEVLVESEPQSDSITTNNNGRWSWNPPTDLTPGEHTITVKWKDATGVIRTIKRNFIVSAAEGPAFESTPSASPLTTIKPTSTPVSVSTSSSTPQPVPETGDLIPTISLFVGGLIILLSSLFVWNKSNAY